MLLLLSIKTLPLAESQCMPRWLTLTPVLSSLADIFVSILLHIVTIVDWL